VIDTQRLRAIATIAVGRRPRGLVLSHDGASLYVAVSGLPKCLRRSPERSAQAAAGPEGRRRGGHRYRDAQADAHVTGVSDPERVEISRDGHSLFVTDEDAARLSVLDAARGRVVATIPVGRSLRECARLDGPLGAGDQRDRQPCHHRRAHARRAAYGTRGQAPRAISPSHR